ncbi:fggy carbohydrate kinase domain-containing protein isoform x2 [Limosa lapponica baueri]|uniref:Fggy carbohydrate kinase domain-containing protein isoform x2 n=1 Tax=Limosa lapponica baueri TaxID=1758121 RepID=A0A2I0TNE5_LIMLA|nr:fggy carbohydrate kinase domain-containing protein isoform x2 [Limosa lapponica baueri]
MGASAIDYMKEAPDRGNHVLSPGEPVGKGLTPEAAKDLGLPEGIAVAASLIDAHAGGLGVIGADVKGHNLPCENQPITSRVAMICGTSSCHMGEGDCILDSVARKVTKLSSFIDIQIA